MIKVFHTPRALFRDVMIAIDDERITMAQEHKAEYVLVAEVATNNLDDAYFLTNTITKAWWKNDGITAKFDGDGCRSTSVGDVMVTEDGKTFLVADFGFREFKFGD